jgi:hypothetical protein
MPRGCPIHGETREGGCYLCSLYANDGRYRALWGGEPVPHVAPQPASTRGPCSYLGEQIGLRDCPPCGGRTQLKVFACSHPAHTETTWDECQRCPDHEPKETHG